MPNKMAFTLITLITLINTLFEGKRVRLPSTLIYPPPLKGGRRDTEGKMKGGRVSYPHSVGFLRVNQGNLMTEERRQEIINLMDEQMLSGMSNSEQMQHFYHMPISEQVEWTNEFYSKYHCDETRSCKLKYYRAVRDSGLDMHHAWVIASNEFGLAARETCRI